jgi:magnesium-transporting ATPase (P-type)
MLIASLIVSGILVILRSWARWFKTHRLPFSAEDMLMYIGLAFFATMCALYLFYLPKLRDIDEVAAGKMAPYANIEADIVAVLKSFLMIEIFFWSTLWAVKLSLLCMFQKLTVGLSTYTKLWWGVMAFTVLTYVGCVVSAFTSCSSMHAWFSPYSKSHLRRYYETATKSSR